MAVTVTNNMTLINNADATTGWSTGTVYTGFQREGSGCLGGQISTTAVHITYTTASTDMTNNVLYIWMKAANPDTLANGGVRIGVGDGTHSRAYYVGGSDAPGFNAGGWECYILDLGNLPTGFAQTVGTLQPNFAAVTSVIIGGIYSSKAVGSSPNFFWDIVRRTPNNAPAITVGGGTSGDPGTWAQIVAADESTTNAWGIVRTLQSGVVGVQGAIRFGNGASASSHFEDLDTVIVFENRRVVSTYYKIDLIGNGTGTNVFKLGNKVGTGNDATGSNGVTIQSAGPQVTLDFSAANFNRVELYGSKLFKIAGGTTFSTNSAHEFVGSTIDQSGTTALNSTSLINSFISSSNQVTANGGTIFGTVFTGSTSSTGALSVSSAAHMDNISYCEFNNNTIGVRLTTAGTYSFIGHLFSNNTTQVDFSGIGTATVNPSNGSNVTQSATTASGGGTITVNAPSVSLTFTGVVNNSEIRVIRVSDGVELGGIENTSGGEWTFLHTLGGTIVNIYILHLNYLWYAVNNYTLLASDAEIPIQQIPDRQYDAGSIP